MSTALGLLSTVGLEVSTRRYELAIRSALGAERAHLLLAVMMPLAWPGLVGLAAGVGLAALVTTGLRRLLFGVHSLDAVTWSVVIVTVLVSVAATTYAQARRAAAVDPAVLIRRT